MSVVAIDAATKAKLLAAGGTAELRDEAGNLVGRFVPEAGGPELTLSEAEVRRRLAPDAKTYSTTEVLEHLRGLK